MSAQGLTKTGVPPQPLWLLYIKIAILVLALIVLGLAAWAQSMIGNNGGYLTNWTGTPGMDIFVAILSFIVYGGAAAIEIWAAHLFFRIAALVAYILTIIFWLSAWAWSASVASDLLGGYYSSDYGTALAACAGLGALVWVLTIVHLVFFVRACLADPQGSAAGQAELGQVKPPAQQQYPAQQPYPVQQPYATQ